MRKHSLARAGLAPLVAAALVGACVARGACCRAGWRGCGRRRVGVLGACGRGRADASTAVWQKSEVVYASLGAEGGVRDVYVVNRFDVEGGGNRRRSRRLRRGAKPDERGGAFARGRRHGVRSRGGHPVLPRRRGARGASVERGDLLPAGRQGGCRPRSWRARPGSWLSI